MMKSQQWLITGGAGFIGRRLSQLLLKSGQSVRMIDNFKTTTREALSQYVNYIELAPDQMGATFSSEVELIVGDIQDADLAVKAATGADVVVHLAANTGVRPSVLDPRQDFMNNCLGVFNYLEAARICKTPRFVFASSGAVIGNLEPPFHEELPVKPASPYGASKLTGEAYCSAYFHSFGLEAVALRFSNVYGPYSSHKESVVTKFISQAIRNEHLEIYGDGNQTRDFIYIDDIVSAIILAGTKQGIGGQVFQVSSNQETSVNSLCQILFPLIEKNGISTIKVVNGEARVGDVKRNFADTKKAREMLGWQYQTSLEDGLAETVNWLINNVQRRVE